MSALPFIENAIEALNKQLSGIDFKLDNNELNLQYQVSPMLWGIFGEVSAGKTTLLNTLIDNNCLPTGTMSTTATTVHIISADSSHANGTVILTPYLEADYLEMLQWLFERIHINSKVNESYLVHAQNILDDPFYLEEYRLEVDAIKRVLQALKNDPAANDFSITITLDELDDQIKDTSLIWKKVMVFLETKWDYFPVEWIDTPGFGHHDLLHRWIAEKALAIVDRGFFLVEPKGASREANTFLQQMSEAKQKQIVLLFSRIDELQDDDDRYAWKHNAKNVIKQINWQGHYFGVSALCTQLARKMQRVELSRKDSFKFRKVAMQSEPLDPEENLRLSGIVSLEKAFIKKQIIYYMTMDIRNYCLTTQSQLEIIKEQITKQKEALKNQEKQTIREVYDSILRKITDEQKQGNKTINENHKKYLDEHHYYFNKVESRWVFDADNLAILIKNTS